MRRYRARALIVSLLAAAVLAPPVARAAVPEVSDGGFESPTLAESIQSFTAPAQIDAWRLEEGTVHLATAAAWPPAAGSQSLVFWQPESYRSTISQDVATDAGQRYHLGWRTADGPPPPGPGYIPCWQMMSIARVKVSWGGQHVATLAGTGHGTDSWTTGGTLVEATAPSTLLQFTSERTDDGWCGMLLDEVALTTPAPSETAITLSAGPNPSAVSETVTLTAHVIGASAQVAPSGNVRFVVDDVPGAASPIDGSGDAELTLDALAAGTHQIGAEFEPQAGSGLASSEAMPVTQVVNKTDTATALEIDPDPSVTGQDVTFTATVTPATARSTPPTGKVQFEEEDGTPIGDPEQLDENGVASIVVYGWAGTYEVFAKYSGDDVFNASSASATQQIDAAATRTTLTSSRNPVPVGGELVWAIAVRALPPSWTSPTGSVILGIDGIRLAVFALDPNGDVELLVVAPDTPGTDRISAEYLENDDFGSSSASILQVVESLPPPPLVVVPTPPPPAVPATPAAPVLVLSVGPRQTLKAALRKGVVARAACSAACRLDARLLLDRTTAKRIGLLAARGPVLIGRATANLPSAGTKDLAVKLTRKARARLAKQRSVRVTLNVAATGTGGTSRLTKRLTLARSRSRVAVLGRVASGQRPAHVTR